MKKEKVETTVIDSGYSHIANGGISMSTEQKTYTYPPIAKSKLKKIFKLKKSPKTSKEPNISNYYSLHLSMSNHGYSADFSIPLGNLAMVEYLEKILSNVKDIMAKDKNRTSEMCNVSVYFENGLIVEKVYGLEKVSGTNSTDQRIERIDYKDPKTGKVVKSKKVDLPGTGSCGSSIRFRKEDIGKAVKDVKEIASEEDDGLEIFSIEDSD